MKIIAFKTNCLFHLCVEPDNSNLIKKLANTSVKTQIDGGRGEMPNKTMC